LDEGSEALAMTDHMVDEDDDEECNKTNSKGGETEKELVRDSDEGLWAERPNLNRPPSKERAHVVSMSNTSSQSQVVDLVRDEASGGASGEGDVDAKGADKKQVHTALMEGAAARVAAKPLTIPRTGTEFESTWKSLAKDNGTGRRLQLLRTIPASALPRIFKEALTAPILTGVLETTLEELSPIDGPAAAALLHALTTTPRFDMAVMFITGKQKLNLQNLWNAAPDPIGALASIRGKFKL